MASPVRPRDIVSHDISSRRSLACSANVWRAQSGIAEILACTPGTVRTRLYYAKQALRKELEGTDG